MARSAVRIAAKSLAFSLVNSWPATLMPACASTEPIQPAPSTEKIPSSRPTNMPAEPASSSLRRPMRSTKKMATKVMPTLMIEVITDVVNESLSLKPTDFQSVVE